VCPGVTASLIDAGHILGSAQVILDVDDGSHALRIAFTGDCGRRDLPILRDPEPIPPCDVLITESTYGDRLHPSRDQLNEQVRAFIEDERGRGGRVLIPAFSVGRTQNVLWYLGNLIHDGLIEPLPIFVDSPLSNKATAIVARHRELYDDETRALLEAGRNPFYFQGVRCVTDVEESKSLNRVREGVILSASGMCEGGRILHHLKHTIGRPEDCVLIVGFQAQGTLGRKLIEGYEQVKIFGERHHVQCRVRHIDGLSAHADRRELVDHLRPLTESVEQVFVVHGEERAAVRFADHLLDAGFRSVEVPLYREGYKLRP
jgi:metallo-beta-lactamase family protein